MKKNKYLILFILMLILNSQNMSAINIDNTNYSLLDGIVTNNPKYFLQLNKEITPNDLTKYSFKGKHINELNMSDLLKKEYRNELLKWDIEDNEDDPTLHPYMTLTMLLMMRVEQLDDINAFIVLSELNKDPSFRYMGLDYYMTTYTYLFFLKYYFLIKASLDTDNYEIFKFQLSTDQIDGSLFSNMCNTEKRFSEEPIYDTYFLSYGTILFQTDALNPLKKYYNSYLDAIRSNQNTYEIDMIYARDSETVYYYDIYKPLKKELKERLTADEYTKFEKKIKPMFDALEIKNYHVNDPDGYVNMRSSPSVNSSIVMQIPNDTYVYYMGEQRNNWVKVKFREATSYGTIGYIYKDRLIEKK